MARFTLQDENRVIVKIQRPGVAEQIARDLDEPCINLRALADDVERLMPREVFEFCFFHAEPHPGDLFWRLAKSGQPDREDLGIGLAGIAK